MAKRQGFTPELEESSLENRGPRDCIRRKVTNTLDVRTRQPVTHSLGKGSCAGREFSCSELRTHKTTHRQASPMAGTEPAHPSKPLRYEGTGMSIPRDGCPPATAVPLAVPHIHRDPEEVIRWHR